MEGFSYERLSFQAMQCLQCSRLVRVSWPLHANETCVRRALKPPEGPATPRRVAAGSLAAVAAAAAICPTRQGVVWGGGVVHWAFLFQEVLAMGIHVLLHTLKAQGHAFLQCNRNQATTTAKPPPRRNPQQRKAPRFLGGASFFRALERITGL